MTRSEFLDRLREALGNDLNNSAVQENVAYYNQYIADEVASGRSETEVIGELGDPWVIARTIIDASEAMAETGSGSGSGYSYEQSGQAYGQSGRAYGQQGSYVNQTEVAKRGRWRLIVMLLGIIGVLIAVVAVIGGIISLVAPFLVPILIVMIIVRAFGRRQ